MLRLPVPPLPLIDSTGKFAFPAKLICRISAVFCKIWCAAFGGIVDDAQQHIRPVLRLLSEKSVETEPQPGQRNSQTEGARHEQDSYSGDRPFGFRHSVDPACALHSGGEPVNCPTDREDLRPRFVRANRGNPIHLERGIPWSQYFQQMGMEPEDRYGFL